MPGDETPRTGSAGASAAPRATPLPYVAALAAGRVAGAAGAQIISVAVGWELWRRTGSAWALGIVGLVELAPIYALFGVAGHAADRFPRRTVALLAQIGLATASIGLAAASLGAAPVAGIYALLLLVGASRAFAQPAVASFVPQLVPAARLAEANAWMASSFQLASVVGPAVGGVLIAARGVAAAEFLAAALQLVFVGVLWRMPRLAPPASPVNERRRDRLLGGLGFVRGQPVLLAAVTLDMFAVLLGGVEALLPIFATDVLRVGATGLGWLRAAPAAGALAMSLAITRLPPWRRPGRTLLATVAGYSLATVAFGSSRSFALSLVFLAALGAFDAVSIVLRSTLTQVLTPDALRGRVAAIVYVFIGSSNELGAFESGAAAALVGAVPAVILGGAGSLLVVLWVALHWPQLARLGPFAALERPAAADDAAR